MQTLYRFKGTVESVSELIDIDNRVVGDVYKCKEDINDYIWNGQDWVNIGQNVDFTEIMQNVEELNQSQQEIVEELSQIATSSKNGMMSSQDKIKLDGISDIMSQAILDADKRKYPIGTLEFNTSGINPLTYLGFGTWVAWGSGRVPVGVNMSDSNFSTVEKTGGSNTVTLNEQQIPSHRHGVRIQWADGDGNVSFNTISATKGNLKVDQGNGTSLAGGGQAHNNLQPYITCYMWKRTA